MQKQYKMCFIGAGNMANAIAGGIVDKGILTADQMIATDTFLPTADKFFKETGIKVIQDNLEAVKNSEVIVLAVKPQVAAQVVNQFKHLIDDNKLIVSIMAGSSLDTLEQWFENGRVMKVNPNTPLMVGKGASVFCSGDGVTNQDKDLIKNIFGSLGVIYEVNEKQADMCTAYSGSGPAYFFEYIRCWTKAATDMGIPEDIALTLIAQTAQGAAEMVLQKKNTPEQLRTNVTSPNGCTQAGLEILSKHNLEGTVEAALTRAVQRVQELGQEQKQQMLKDKALLKQNNQGDVVEKHQKLNEKVSYN